MDSPDRNLVAWNALRSTRGLGPKGLATLAEILSEQRRPASDLLGTATAELVGLGLRGPLGQRVAAALADPPVPPPSFPAAPVVCPDDPEYPRDRLTPQLPLPVLLYCLGNTSLLRMGGIAISGSRSAHPEALRFAAEAARFAAKSGINVISGHAAGVDETAHGGALEAGGSTTAVLAEGLMHFKPRPSLREADEAKLLIVSEFDPGERWRVGNAMQRNVTIAALADAVVVVAANLRGGSWAQAELALEAGKPILVPDFPEDIAPGNRPLIDLGATPISHSLPGTSWTMSRDYRN